MEDYIPGAVLMGAVAAVFLLRRVMSPEAQQDRRLILVIMGAVVISAVAGILIGSSGIISP